MKKEIMETLKKKYPVSARVRLLKMEDQYAPPTVTGIDGIGSIMVNWDNGSQLHVLYGEDKIELI